MKKILDAKFRLECKIAEKVQEVKNALENQKGLTIMEILMILGFSIIILGLTFMVAKPAIDTWWTNKVMPYWS